MKNSGNILLIVLVSVAVLAIGAGGFWWWRTASAPVQKACTMEAKICPDGSAVGRTGPNCEFAACPADTIVNWKTYTNPTIGFELKYPPNWYVNESGSRIFIANKQITDEVLRTLTHGLPGAFTILDYSDSQWHKDFAYNLMSTLTPLKSASGNEYARVEKAKVDNLDAVKTIQFGEGDMTSVGGYQTDYYIFSGSKLLNIYFPNKYNQDFYSTVYDQILSTFKFL